MLQKFFFILLLLLLSYQVHSQINLSPFDKELVVLQVEKVLLAQEQAWNNGDIALYMKGYWQSDSLKFIGKKGIQYGWQKTLDAYQSSYPNRVVMGFLTFSEINVEVLSKEAAFVIGKWQLKSEKNDVGGIFTLLFKQINGNWVIVCDHTS